MDSSFRMWFVYMYILLVFCCYFFLLSGQKRQLFLKLNLIWEILCANMHGVMWWQVCFFFQSLFPLHFSHIPTSCSKANYIFSTLKYLSLQPQTVLIYTHASQCMCTWRTHCYQNEPEVCKFWQPLREHCQDCRMDWRCSHLFVCLYSPPLSMYQFCILWWSSKLPSWSSQYLALSSTLHSSYHTGILCIFHMSYLRTSLNLSQSTALELHLTAFWLIIWLDIL